MQVVSAALQAPSHMGSFGGQADLHIAWVASQACWQDFASLAQVAVQSLGRAAVRGRGRVGRLRVRGLVGGRSRVGGRVGFARRSGFDRRVGARVLRGQHPGSVVHDELARGDARARDDQRDREGERPHHVPPSPAPEIHAVAVGAARPVVTSRIPPTASPTTPRPSATSAMRASFRADA